MRTLLQKEWWAETAERAIKTFAQSLVGFLVVGGTAGTIGFIDVDWAQATSVSGVAALASVLWRVSNINDKDAKEIVVINSANPTPKEITPETVEETVARIKNS